jgi:oxygen-independent coproporphyrinogen-3 oxidase
LKEEITCELNPEDVNDRILAFLHDRGVNRISLGVQSMITRSQRILKRCGPETNTRAIESATKIFSNVNLDVLLGIPGGSLEQQKRTVERLARYQPAHFSVYCIEPGGDLAGEVDGFFSGVDPDRSVDEYLYVCDRMRGLGYVHYEVSNFALPGRESLHNRCYWAGGEYVGVGPGAHSFMDGRRYHNLPSLKTYLTEGWAGTDKIRVYDRRDSAAVETERLMLALRTSGGAPLQWAVCGDTVIRDIVSGGLARIETDRLVLSDRGYMVMNDILLRLLNTGDERVAGEGHPRLY